MGARIAGLAGKLQHAAAAVQEAVLGAFVAHPPAVHQVGQLARIARIGGRVERPARPEARRPHLWQPVGAVRQVFVFHGERLRLVQHLGQEMRDPVRRGGDFPAVEHRLPEPERLAVAGAHLGR
jgi:hypothetical protein